MTLRAEEVTIVNQGVKGKDFGFYKEEVIELSRQLGIDSLLEEHVVKKEMFLLESLAHFLNKIQEAESLYKDKPFETRIGAGELFLKPVLEVRVRETGKLVAIFPTIDAYKEVEMGKEELERILDKKIADQAKGRKVKHKMEKAIELKNDPSLIFQSKFNDFLNQEISEKGFFKGLYAYILRRKHHEFYASEKGQKGLEKEIARLSKELDEVHLTIEGYATEVESYETSKVKHEKYQAGFDYLASLYQIPTVYQIQKENL